MIHRSDPAFLYRCRAESADTPEEAEKWLAKAREVEEDAAAPGPRHDFEVSRPRLVCATDKPLSLSAARAHKTRSAKDWTVRDALEHALADLDKPETTIARSTRCVLIFGAVADSGETDTAMVVATANRFERDGLLAGALSE